MESLETTCLMIIGNAGAARASYVEAIEVAREGDFEEAEKIMARAGEEFLEAHRAHAAMLSAASAGESLITEEDKESPEEALRLLMIHAEDQLMAADSFSILCEQFIELYKKLLTK
ncbi:MAG: PTS lactose/cellobiose transporter subunit IIA [Lachnospiraceae bacterium]|nr:PTS lactose/cellobiose transporter subunit IIA [Lachnospiraceae bacterium]